MLGDGFGGALGHEAAAVSSSIRSEIDNKVGCFDHVKLMLDNNNGVSLGAQFKKNGKEMLNIHKVEAGGRFIQNKAGSSGGASGEFVSKFDPLGFAAGKGGGGLSKAKVAEADAGEHFKFFSNGRDIAKEGEALINGQIKHIGDGVTFKRDFERFAVEPFSFADITRHIDIGKEKHFDFAHAVALAVFAATSRDIEAEAAAGVAPDAGGGELGKEIADGGESAGVGEEIGAGCAAERALIDLDHFVESIEAIDSEMATWFLFVAVERAGEGPCENVFDESALARSADPGNNGKATDWKRCGDVLEIVFRSIDHGEPVVVRNFSFFRNGKVSRRGEKSASDRGGMVDQLAGCPFSNDGSAALASSRTEIDHVVCRPNGFFIVFDDYHGIALVPEAVERFDELGIVRLMKADAGFVENVEHPGQPRSDLSGQADSLCFSA